MESTLGEICRFCLNKCRDFEVVEESHQEVLNILRLNLDLSISHAPVMCKICAENLQQCFAFKTTSLNLKDIINLIVNMCLFCKHPGNFGSCVYLNSEDDLDVLLLKAMMEQYFPELELAHPGRVVCTYCYRRLQENFDFIINCLSIEQQIKRYCKAVGTDEKDQVTLRNVVEFFTITRVEDNESASCANVKIEEKPCVDKKDDPLVVKMENSWEEEDNILLDQIKVEKYEPEVLQEGVSLNNIYEVMKIEETWMDDSVVNVEKPVDTINETIETVIRKWSSRDGNTLGIHIVGSFDKTDCVNLEGNDMDEYEDEAKRKKHRRKWWFNSAAVEGLDSSPQKVFFKKTVLRSMITRVNISGDIKYQCQVCHFIARAKCSMNRHMVIHQDPSEVTMYRCYTCNYETRHKSCLSMHVLKHRDRSNTIMYKCDLCPLQTRYKGYLRLHKALHRPKADLDKVQCHLCSLKAPNKRRLKYHMRTHSLGKDNEPMFRCGKCPYQAVRYYNLWKHKQSHKDPSALPIYLCDFCDYTSNTKKNCVRHMRQHREPVQCKWCDFKTKHPNTMSKHVKQHIGRRDILG